MPYSGSPVVAGEIVVWYPTTEYPHGQSFAWRNADADCIFRYVDVKGIRNMSGDQVIEHLYIWRNIYSEALEITETTPDARSLTPSEIEQLQAPGYYMVKYENQLYYRYDPREALNDTLNYIHLDSIQDDNGVYKVTGKCFSVSVSSGEWQVVDLDFGGTRTTHNLIIEYSARGTTIYFSLINNRPETYEGAPADLCSALENSPITCTVDANGSYAAGIITTDGYNFIAIYGNGEKLWMDQTQINITDNIV